MGIKREVSRKDEGPEINVDVADLDNVMLNLEKTPGRLFPKYYEANGKEKEKILEQIYNSQNVLLKIYEVIPSLIPYIKKHVNGDNPEMKKRGEEILAFLGERFGGVIC